MRRTTVTPTVTVTVTVTQDGLRSTANANDTKCPAEAAQDLADRVSVKLTQPIRSV